MRAIAVQSMHATEGFAMASELTGQELEAITTRTLAHYERAAEDFWRGTRDHDVSQNIEALLRHIEGKPPFTILDLGCGPGRDLLALKQRGHVAIGLEASPRFAAMARAYSGCEVWEQNFLALDLPAARFDGVFANASLFHVPSQELPRVLEALHAALAPRGVLFSSNPRGANEEGWSYGRYGAFWELERWRSYLCRAGFVEIEHYYRPEGVPVEQRPWLASVWRALAA
jgi:SAM-dependent methyltransferase